VSLMTVRLALTFPQTQLGLASLCEPVQGNFLEMPFADGTYDGAYAIEATCHADKVRTPLA